MILLNPKYDLSIVIPTGGDDERLELALLGYAAQTDPHFEIQLVNDGGSETTAELAARFRDRLVIHYHYLPGGGYRPASARNLGLQHCGGTRVILSDGDVIPCPTAVEEHKRYGKQKTYVLGLRRRISRGVTERLILPQVRAGVWDVSRTPTYPWADDQRLLEPRFSRIFRHLQWGTDPPEEVFTAFCDYFQMDRDRLRDGLWQSLLCWTFNVSFSGPGHYFNSAFDRNYGFEDLEFGLRLIAAGYKVVVNNRIIVYHLDHAPRAVESRKQNRIFLESLSRIRGDSDGPQD